MSMTLFDWAETKAPAQRHSVTSVAAAGQIEPHLGALQVKVLETKRPVGRPRRILAEGESVTCVVSRSGRVRYYTESDRERRREYGRMYRKSHREQCTESNRNWRHRNPEKARAQKRRYRQKNADKMQEYRVRNRERINERARLNVKKLSEKNRRYRERTDFAIRNYQRVSGCPEQLIELKVLTLKIAKEIRDHEGNAKNKQHAPSRIVRGIRQTARRRTEAGRRKGNQ